MAENEFPIPNPVPVSIPDFVGPYLQEVRDGGDPKVITSKMEKKDWVTSELYQEINGLLPEPHEKDASGKRCPLGYLAKISLLFPPGRVFASYTQLCQASKMFLDAWAVQKVHSQKKITCSYGLNHGKKSQLHGDDVSKQRKSRSSVKNLDSPCPFSISYSLVNVYKPDKKPGVFYLAKITTVNYEHNCCMSSMSHRVALRRSGQAQPNLEGMNTILSLLKEQPALLNTILCPLLQKYLPHYKAMDPSFMRNFKNRALQFIIQDPCHELSMQEVIQVTSQSNCAANKTIDLDQPLLRQNCTSLLRKCMQ